jgi:hypothetical protein
MKIKKLGGFFSLIFVLAFLAAGTFFIYYYSKGYRIDIITREIEKTGVITVETTPRRATIFLNGEEKGKSPKAITGLEEGEHTVLIQKDGYQDWVMNVTVLAEQSIPVEATLFYSEPNIELISIEDIPEYMIDQIFFDENNQIAIFTVLQENESLLQVWGYPINRRFWELETNPYLITEFYISDINPESTTPLVNSAEYDIHISPNSQRAFLTTKIEDVDYYFIFYTDRFISSPTEIEDIRYTGSISPTWSNDSQYLMFSKNNELRTINIDSLVQTVISSKSEDQNFIWTSTDTSQIYYLEQFENDYSVVRIRATGNNKSTVLENVISLNELSYTENTESSSHIPSEIHLSTNGNFMIIFEEDRILVYSFNEDEFFLYPAETPVFLGFSPESEKFLYSNGSTPNLYEYNLIVSNGDPIHVLGPRLLVDIHSTYDPLYYKWDPEAKTVLFTTENTELDNYSFVGLSIDGLNKYVLYGLSYNKGFAVGNSGKYLIGVCEGSVLCKVTVRE